MVVGLIEGFARHWATSCILTHGPVPPFDPTFGEAFMTKTPDIALFTCTFSGDREYFRLLCESIDRHAPDFVHVAAVPKHELHLFREFTGEKRRIISMEDFLPSGVHRIPLPPRSWRKKLGVLVRDQYWVRPNLRVNGWVMQQIVKFEASRTLGHSVVVHLDSDTVLIRDLKVGDFVTKGRARLFRETFDTKYDDHQVWVEECARMLALTGEIPKDVHYVGWPVVWHQGVIEALKAQIEKLHEGDWRHNLIRMKMLSEYHLYGLYYEFIHEPKVEHYLNNEKQMILRTLEGPADLTSEVPDVIGEIGPDTIGCCLQSTLSASIEERRAVSDALREAAKRGAS